MPSRNTPRWPAWVMLIASAALVSVPLPDYMTPFRPPWATMVVIYWIMMWPRAFGLGTAWLVGLLLDILQGELLGQHALALTVVGYLTLRFHLQIRIFPLWQLTATVFALMAIDAFILFWIDGVAGNPPVGLARWTQVLMGAILWPIVMAIMDRVRERIGRRDPTFT
ncbi:MAG: rod shape-determining protein MreD [Gammaproteobacteria bacterium]